MAYDPSAYNPWQGNNMLGNQQRFQQQPVNGLIFMDLNSIETYQMPAGSVSAPLFIDDKHCAIKTFDTTGGSSTEFFELKSIPKSDLLDPHDINVTKADLDAFKAEIMEAINGRHSIAAVQATPAEQDAE